MSSADVHAVPPPTVNNGNNQAVADSEAGGSSSPGDGGNPYFKKRALGSGKGAPNQRETSISLSILSFIGAQDRHTIRQASQGCTS